jgi:hypothetical protein
VALTLNFSDDEEIGAWIWKSIFYMAMAKLCLAT